MNNFPSRLLICLKFGYQTVCRSVLMPISQNTIIALSFMKSFWTFFSLLTSCLRQLPQSLSDGNRNW